MLVIKQEWEHRLSQEQLECQRQLVELQAKHGLHIQNLQGEYQALLDARLDALQKEQTQETEKLKRECESLRDNYQSRLSSEYLPIAKHEHLMNEEIAKAAERYQEQVRRLREQVEKQMVLKLEERDRGHQDALSKAETRH